MFNDGYCASFPTNLKDKLVKLKMVRGLWLFLDFTIISPYEEKLCLKNKGIISILNLIVFFFYLRKVFFSTIKNRSDIDGVDLLKILTVEKFKLHWLIKLMRFNFLRRF